MRRALIAMLVLGFAPQALAADIEAGKATATAVCAACHGANGVSVKAEWPNLAGQKAKYLVKQLEAFKAGQRKNALMNAIAPQLSDADIENVAAYFSSLPGASGSAVSNALANMLNTHVTFPKNYRSTFKPYTTINLAKKKQVRVYFANKVALAAAAEGKPLPLGSMILVEAYKAKLDDAKKPIKGSDGSFVKDKLAFYTAMANEAGWGKDIPEILRNGDWNYAVINSEGTLKKRSQADCFACHKPLKSDSYVFTIDTLKAFASAQ